MRLKLHQRFVRATESILLGKLAYTSAYPVGRWLNGATRPDILIVQESGLGRSKISGRRSALSIYDQLYVVECKVDPLDLQNAPYQLIMAQNSLSGQGTFDLHHGGVRPLIAIPRNLVTELKRKRNFTTIFRVLGELYFGLYVIDEKRQSFKAVLQPQSFMGR